MRAGYQAGKLTKKVNGDAQMRRMWRCSRLGWTRAAVSYIHLRIYTGYTWTNVICIHGSVTGERRET